MQLELFPSLYPPEWVCSICGKDTSKIEYDYIGSGYNHLGCEMKIELKKEIQFLILFNTTSSPLGD